jgi:hypothetical protein
VNVEGGNPRDGCRVCLGRPAASPAVALPPPKALPASHVLPAVQAHSHALRSPSPLRASFPRLQLR